MKVMNDELKRIISTFLFVSVLIACLTLFGAGTLTARQRSEYNSYRTHYAVLTLKNEGDRVNIKVDDRQINLALTLPEKLREYKDYIYFTPFSTFFFFSECVYEIFSA